MKKVSKERLQELENESVKVFRGVPDPSASKYYHDIVSVIVEVDTMRQAIKKQGSILDSREELIIKLIVDGERLAQILSDGEGKEDEICCVDYFHARDAVYKHAELIEQL